MNKRVEIWDGWRGIAITFLLTGHFLKTYWIWEERLGVDIFFVLSGMLMSKILFEKRMKLKDFYVRRLSRIIPALLSLVLTVYAIATIAGWEYQTREIFANLFFVRTYWPTQPHIWEAAVPLGHLWSLNVEEHAYVIMSIMTLLFVRNQYAAATLIVLGLGSIGICFYHYYSPDQLEPLFRIRTECAISFIFLSAGYSLLKSRKKFNPPSWLPVIAFVLTIPCYLNSAPGWMTFSIAPVLLAFVVNHLLDASKFFRAFLELKFFRMMGLWSYSIYLWQQPFYKFSYVLPGGSFTGLALAILLGYISFTVYENPVRGWINRQFSRQYEPVSE